MWHFLWFLIRVCFSVPTVSSGCSQQTGSEWRQPWKTVISLLAEWDTKILKLPLFPMLLFSCFALSLNLLPFVSLLLYFRLSLLSVSCLSPSSFIFSIHPSFSLLTIQLILYSPKTAADCCFPRLFGVLFSGCLHDLPLRTDFALVVMK